MLRKMFRATFYSFRGGVGRTMAMANVAYHLALARQDVVLIDFDLEAPGLTLMPEFQPAEGGAPAVSGGLAAFLAAGLKNERVPKVKDLCYVPQIQTMANLKGKIHVLPAGEITGAKSSYDVSGLRLDDLYADMPRSVVLDDLLLQIEEDIAPAYLLIDSRTGLTEIGGICTTHLGEYVVVLFGLNEQNLKGTALMLERLRRVREDLASKCILVASPVPQGEERLKSERLGRARELLAPALDVSPDNMSDILTIPYHPELALTEASFVARFPDSELAAAYNRITKALRERNPSDSRYRYDIAVAMLPENPMRAMQLLDELRTSEDVPEAHMFRGLILDLLFSNMDEADAAFQKALQLEPVNAGFLMNYALFLNRHDRVDEAADYYRRAVEADPRNAEDMRIYGWFLFDSRGDIEGAMRLTEAGLAEEPDHRTLLLNRGLFLLLLGRVEEARASYEAALGAGGQANAKELQAGLKDLREAVSKYPEAKGVQEMADWFEGMVAQRLEGNAEPGREGTAPSGKKG